MFTFDMMNWRIVSQEFPVLSDLISPPQLTQTRSVFSHWSFSFCVFMSQNQFRELMNQNQELMNQVCDLKTFRRISQASARSASVLNPLTSHASARFTSVLNLLISHASARFTSVLNSFTVCSIISFSSVRAINTEGDKVKVNSLFTFEPSADIWLWILEVNDYFTLWKVTDVNAQVTVTCFYLRDMLQRHTQRLRLAEDVKPFSTWLKLQVWLLVNYSLSDTGLKADLAMNKLQMQLKESV